MKVLHYNNNLHKFTDLKEGTDYDQITGNRYGWNLTSASADRSEFPVSLCHLLKRSKVTDYHTQKTLYQSEIPKQTALSLLNACQSEKLGITAHIRHEYLLQGHSLVFLGRLIYGKDARKVRYVQNMEQTIQELSCDVKELQFYFFQKLHAAAQNASCKLPVSSCCLHRSVCRDLFIRTLQRGALTHLAQSLGIAKSEIACIGD